MFLALPLITALKKLCNTPQLIYEMYQVKLFLIII